MSLIHLEEDCIVFSLKSFILDREWKISGSMVATNVVTIKVALRLSIVV